jgi:hypothetical protein
MSRPAWSSTPPRTVRHSTVSSVRSVVVHPARPLSPFWMGPASAAATPGGCPMVAPPVSPLKRSLEPVPMEASPSSAMDSGPLALTGSTGRNASATRMWPVA